MRVLLIPNATVAKVPARQVARHRAALLPRVPNYQAQARLHRAQWRLATEKTLSPRNLDRAPALLAEPTRAMPGAFPAPAVEPATSNVPTSWTQRLWRGVCSFAAEAVPCVMSSIFSTAVLGATRLALAGVFFTPAACGCAFAVGVVLAYGLRRWSKDVFATLKAAERFVEQKLKAGWATLVRWFWAGYSNGKQIYGKVKKFIDRAPPWARRAAKWAFVALLVRVLFGLPVAVASERLLRAARRG